MKILLTGGGTGGHFYPLIAVAREIIKITREKRIIEPKLIYASDTPYDEKLLFQENIKFFKLPAGKMRRYFSLMNFIDPFKTLIGVVIAVFRLYFEMPDVIFSKGGYASVPALVAAKIFKIPLVIHESDSVPGKSSMFAKNFAGRIAISFAETAEFFQKEKVALTGNPIRREVIGGNFYEAEDLFKLEFQSKENSDSKFNPPVLLIIGGSQGAQKINNVVLDALPDIVKEYQIIHQCGKKNFDEIKKISEMILKDDKNKSRYHLYSSLNENELRNASFAADLVVSRAGASSIFEIAAWGRPSILIPLEGSAQDHQKKNAWGYAASGACEVVEEENLAPHILVSEINNIIKNPEKRQKMREEALKFSRLDAAESIANEVINLALEHTN